MAMSPPVDRQSRRVLVEVVPPEPEELAPAQAGEGRHPQGREEPVTGGGSQERPQLLGGPGTRLDLRDGPQAWGVGDQGDVAGDEPSADGICERATDHQVDLVHGLGG